MLSCRDRSRQRGATIVEMTMALGLVALLAAMALPSFSVWQGNTRLRASADVIHTGLSLARTEAITRNTSVSFTLQSDGAWSVDCATVTTECPAQIHRRAAGEAGGSVALTLTQRNDSPASNSATVTFSSRGRPDAAATSLRRIDIDLPATFVPAAQSQNLRIVVTEFGRTRLCDPNAASGAPTAC